MKITKIEKKKRLYLLILDETERLYVTEDTIVRFFLSKGMELEENQLEEIRQFAQFSYGKNLALYHLSFQKRTEKEVADYLKKYEIEDSIIQQVVMELKKDKWLDDHSYTEQVVFQNSLSGDKGPFALRQRLQRKGVDRSLIEGVLEEEDFAPIAQRVAEKVLRKYEAKLPSSALKAKLLQQLMNKGFTSTQAKNAYEQLIIETDEDLEEELLYKELDKQYRKYARKYDGYELQQRLTQALARRGYSFRAIRQALRDYLD